VRWNPGTVGGKVRVIASALVALVLLAPLLAGGSGRVAHAQFGGVLPGLESNVDLDVPLEIEPRPAWVRSFTCPIVYTHEVPSRAAFRGLLVGLRAYGYEPISLRTLDQAFTGAVPVPHGCMVLTFDDALMSQSLNALPVLIELKIPAVFFVMPDFDDGVHTYMRPAQIKALTVAGEEVMAHTCNHATLPTLLRRNPMAFLAEIVDCRARVEAITNRSISYIAYPNGSYDAPVIEELRDAGYAAAFTTRPSSFLSASSPYTLPRIAFNPSETAGSLVSRMRNPTPS